MSVVRIFEDKKSLASMGEGPQWAVHVDRHEGREPNIRCALHRGLLSGLSGDSRSQFNWEHRPKPDRKRRLAPTFQPVV